MGFYQDKLDYYFRNHLDEDLKPRIKSYIKEEPSTLEWIESFNSNSIFYDIGSNIGGYSIISIINHPKIKVYSFEPNFMNFYIQASVCKDNKIKNLFPLNIAINNNNQFNYFKYDYREGNFPPLEKGNIGPFRIPFIGSKGNFGEELKEQMLKSDYSNPFKRGINLEVGILGLSLDSLIYEFNLPIPNYLKIDIDGNELLVLKGAKRLLKEPDLKEIFVEIDDKIYKNNTIENFIEKYNFSKEKDINMATIINKKSKKLMRMVLYKRK